MRWTALKVLAVCWVASGLIVNNGSEEKVYEHHTASFGPRPGSYFVKSAIVKSVTRTGCDPVQDGIYKDDIVLLERGNCSFLDKVLRAQEAGAVGVVVGNSAEASDAFVTMGPGTDNEEAHHVTIASIFVLHSTYLAIQDELGPNTSISATLSSTGEIQLLAQQEEMLELLSILLSVLPMVWCLAVILLVAKRAFARLQRRHARRQQLADLPMVTYEEYNETQEEYKDRIHNASCPICFEDYERGDQLKRLPCNHAYHDTCIDPWLANRSETCPICKQSIIGDYDQPSRWARFCTMMSSFVPFRSTRYRHVQHDEFPASIRMQ